MKVAPTLDGRLRIDVESEVDRMILMAISFDARNGGYDLASRVSGTMDEDLAGDWGEFVVPELREGYEGQLAAVDQAVGKLGDEGVGEVYIDGDKAEAWFGALNQARLALEERYRLSERELEQLESETRSAWYRSQFYQRVQGLLLEFLMG